MFDFKQNNEMTYIESKYVKENAFINKETDTEKLPLYEDIKDMLPIPVFEGHNDYIECYYYAWKIAFSNIRRAADGQKLVSNYIDAAFNDSLFMWDSSFMLMFGKYADRIFNFQKTLDNFYALQHKDGFICREIYETNGCDKFSRFDPSATGPNIMPLCEWLYFKHYGDKERLKLVYYPLRAYHIWLRQNHTWRDGTYFSSGWGCGMDNSPRLKPGYSAEFSHGHMVWIDACFQQILSCEILIKMNDILKIDDTSDLSEEISKLKKYLNIYAWDENTAYYYDIWDDGTLNKVKHIGSYWALLSDVIPHERLEPFISHLKNEKEFNRPNAVPTLSCDHPQYDKNGGYWCGAVWAPTNYMVLKGLTRQGYDELATDIAKKYLKNVVAVFNKTGTLWENYSPETEMPGAPAKDKFVGWTGLAPISVFFEYILGITADAEQNQIIWNITHTEEHGIKNYRFGKNHTVDLICLKRATSNEEPVLKIKSNSPLKIIVKWDNNKKTINI